MKKIFRITISNCDHCNYRKVETLGILHKPTFINDIICIYPGSDIVWVLIFQSSDKDPDTGKNMGDE